MCSARENEMKLTRLLKKKETTICNLGEIVDSDVPSHPCGKLGLQECSVVKYQECYIKYYQKCGVYE